MKNNNKRIKTMRNNVIILTIAICMLHLLFTNIFASKELDTKEYVVMRGETLWSIAEGLYSEENSDIQKIVYDIKDVNNMSESIVYEGQIINLPVYL